jgi:hypothetical protein
MCMMDCTPREADSGLPPPSLHHPLGHALGRPPLSHRLGELLREAAAEPQLVQHLLKGGALVTPIEDPQSTEHDGVSGSSTQRSCRRRAGARGALREAYAAMRTARVCGLTGAGRPGGGGGGPPSAHEVGEHASHPLPVQALEAASTPSHPAPDVVRRRRPRSGARRPWTARGGQPQALPSRRAHGPHAAHPSERRGGAVAG